MESSPHTAVAPVRPVAAYIGGKRSLARRLISLIETIPHRTYAEPFVGMGGVFLRRASRPGAEVINDWSQDVATFYRVLQRHHVAFLDMLRFQITSRAEFERLVKVEPSTLTDLERSARFLYLQRTAFGGKVNGRHFGVSHHRSGRMDVTKLAGDLQELHERLSGVIIERLPFEAFLARYDNDSTLFFLDPPYWGCEDDYGRDMFSRADFDVLRAALGALKGRFVLTINDRPETRALFQGFDIQAVGVNYGITGQGATAAKELIVSN